MKLKPLICVLWAISVLVFWFTIKAYHETPRPIKTCNIMTAVAADQRVQTEWEIAITDKCSARDVGIDTGRG